MAFCVHHGRACSWFSLSPLGWSSPPKFSLRTLSSPIRRYSLWGAKYEWVLECQKVHKFKAQIKNIVPHAKQILGSEATPHHGCESLKHLAMDKPQLNGSTGGNLATQPIKPQPKLLLDHRYSFSCIRDKVIVINNISAAKEIVGLLTTKYRNHVHACDTVSKIDVEKETPVGRGEIIICFSIYSGSNVDFGNGQSCIWVDVLDGGGKNLLMEFAPFFEDPSIKKVWHNYSSHSHLIENYGIRLSGFHADTMHMARLWDSSRKTEVGYSLEVLTKDPMVMNYEGRSPINMELIGKPSMKTIFGKKKLNQNGQEGKNITVPPVEEIQREEQNLWICYSALDSMSTLQLFESLKSKLKSMDWVFNGERKGSMFEFYEEYWRPFGELLVRIETEGMLVVRSYLAEIEKVATPELQIETDRFRNWAARYCPDAMHMNVGSDSRMRDLFFGGTQNPRSLGVKMIPEKYTPSGLPSVSGDVLKTLAGTVSSEYEEDVDISCYGTAYKAFVASNKGDKEGKEACHAIAALFEARSIHSLLSDFILPLQSSDILGKKSGRIHCSLNINTETGRLSARRPNLQGLPALEKDRYKIRQAFIAAPGNSLIVADYGQLELRILAHLANCKSMKDAFKAGGDFHSRTALNMFRHIRKAVENNQVLLEWYPQPGEDKPPVPLLKDAFASERRKAKLLNFSIAYGKTPNGIAKDWNVPLKEARTTVDLWYSDRKEVENWKNEIKHQLKTDGCVKSLLGRTRTFPSVKGASKAPKGRIERAAINTPVQASAADVAMCAMLEISKNSQLNVLGWRLRLQVHDELILEGPSESAEAAKAIVVECMSKPFNGRNILDVELVVDVKCVQNWYSAK